VNLLANPDALEWGGLGGDDQRTRVAATTGGGIAGFIADHEVRTRFGPGIRIHLDVTP
jgi:hypothetical protein